MFLKPFLPVLLIAAAATALPAQTPARAQLLAGEFSKRKDAVKQKHGVTVRKFHEVVSEAWLASPAGYAGTYVPESPAVEVRVTRDGSASGSGVDVARFVLRDLRIADGLLTGTKPYADGRAEPFGAVFLERADRARPNDDFAVSYGLGFLTVLPGSGVDTPLRVFARRQ
jgi:hypothetical protein